MADANRFNIWWRAGLCGVLSVSLLAGVGCASTEPSGRKSGSPGKSRRSGVGTAMPSLVVKRLGNGKALDLGALHDKVALVDIWASWCGPCKEEMPLLDEMAGRLKSKRIEIIAVSIDEDRESATAFLSSRKDWRLTVAHDPEGKVPDILKPGKMPTSYVIDKEGIIRYVNEGFSRDDIAKLEKRLVELAESAS